MEREKLLNAIKPRMPEKRYVHTIGVMETAIGLAQRYGEDSKKAEIAAILHDVAKYANEEWMRDIVRTHSLGSDLIAWGTEILHGPVGAWVAQTEFQVEDEAILNAIRFHTTGRANMTKLEEILFIADMIEPNRKFPGVDALREIAQQDLKLAMRACIQHSVAHLIKMELAIYPRSIECYNYYISMEQKPSLQ
ncbi:bis(5'-nucleosyl)-tetraphosphatase (symmetrical) YqeK [Metasolibacillus meyeri]|uniref:bis(5'-nucleosyl)-tetraphosphatase (symmetrical) n=1 Tax=Metasolibacillus meyeri TaxID=1071052 RepID=A0AAW9NU15_9BACL|nr:bis(5'-nucleosyl)-tetraphosphatase (symmetrical) YqeK [Metasolibacillus meyeri]MEC1179862.1 bis(5'-nucleosyl)-tetraphosphatase (symmetrical) YqeK [Metasolibacillus meyeri]